ncbi:MAG: hypothetical protein HKL96_02660 [Phycisphaerales bacterium]|nr:hypothetical protein [Phycisphaerales bacterium]
MRNVISLRPRCALPLPALAAWFGAAVVVHGSSAALPQTTDQTLAALARLERQIAALQRQVKGYHRLKQEVAKLRQRDDATWRQQQEQTLIKRLATSVLREAKRQEGYQIGYDDGFFMQSPHQANKLVINGELQFRYMYTHSNGFISPGPTDSSGSGDTSGFSFRRARLTFSGNIISPNLQYNIQGDFAGDSSNNGNFQLNNLWFAWQISPMLGLRFGAFAVPFSKVQWYENEWAFDLQETPEELVPFDPDHSLGVSAFGDLVANKLGYEVMVNDGSQANVTGCSSAVNGAQDNRLGIYGRVQWAGAGGESDFADEPDYKNRNHFVWMLGGALGYESQNATGTAFPAPQTTLVAQGLSAANPAAFLAPIAFTGNLYRATADWSAKYRGLSVNTAVYFQQFNDTLASGAANVFENEMGRSSVYQLGYFVQAGYFVVPHHWQVAARVGQVLSSGPKRMEAYSLGLNYYFAGYHASVLSDVTYIPDAAYTDAQTGTFVNSCDLICKVQFQLWF